jgi:hypothetical protein
VLRLILLGAVLAYLRIPARCRYRACALVGRTTPTAHLALAGLRAGDTRAFIQAADGWLNGPLAQGGRP